MQSQIKSKERVKKFAEVFTNPREVNAMLDLVKDETQKIESTFLEPSCGTGNFLVEILRRKLEVANNDQERIVALSSIYGADIQLDNVKTSRLRMLQMMMDKVDWSYLATCIQILNKNIIKGDFLKNELPTL